MTTHDSPLREAELRPRNLDPYVQQEKIRTIHYGIGAIGAEVVRAVLANPDVEIVAAIDSHPSKTGRDLGDVAGAGHTLGIPIQYEADSVLKDVYADVVLHCTGSSLTEVYPQLMDIVSSEKNVVSSCEELAFPWVRYPEISQKLDRRARETGVRILGAGVNPGFVMDLLPLMLLTACRQVNSIRVERVVDVGKRRLQLQRKVGIGFSVDGFRHAAGLGAVGHVGLRESVFMIADTLGWRLEDVSETLEPVLARKKSKTRYFSIEKGYVLGIRQTAVGISSGREAVHLTLEMSLDAAEPRDVIQIDGQPPVKATIPGGIHGDTATGAILANCIPAVAQGRASGLITMRDLPLLPYYRQSRQPRDILS